MPEPQVASENGLGLETAAPEHVREATLAGVRWGVVARIGIETATFISSAALARLVSPAGFGRAAIALAVVSIAAALAVEGFGTPIVQRRVVDRKHIEVTLLLSVASGLALSAICFALTPLLGDSLGAQTASLVRLASPVFLIVSLTVVPQALQQRRLNFRATSVSEMASLTVGVALSVALALLGLGARALILGQLAIFASSAVMYLATMPRVLPRWHGRQAREIVGFGSQTTLASLLFSLYSNLDYVVVGGQLGARATGFYWRAFQIGGVYQGKISQIMLRLALPVYSRTRDLEDMRRVRGRIVRVHASVIFPLLATYVVAAPAIVPLVFGASWTPAVVPSQLLAFAGMTFALGTGTAALVVAAGRPRAVLINNTVSVSLYFTVVFVFARYGLTTLCISIVVLNTIGYLVTYYVLMYRIVGIPIRQLWEEIGPATLSLLSLFACATPVASLLAAVGAPDIASIGGISAVALLAYSASLWLFFRDTWADLALLVTRVLRSR